MIEDSTVGITAAHSAGMHVAALIDRRFNFDRNLADFELGSLNDIPGLVEKISGNAVRRAVYPDWLQNI